MIRVYFASNTENAALIEALSEVSPFFHVTSRWPKMIRLGFACSGDNGTARKCWDFDEQDIAASDYLFLWARKGQSLRGAICEAGMAIAYKKPVILSGDHPAFGTWQFHKQCIRTKTLYAGLQKLRDKNFEEVEHVYNYPSMPSEYVYKDDLERLENIIREFRIDPRVE